MLTESAAPEAALSCLGRRAPCCVTRRLKPHCLSLSPPSEPAMSYRTLLLLLSFPLLLSACVAASEPGAAPRGGEALADTETREWADKNIGDVRIFYYVKPGARGASGVDQNEDQKEVRITLINRTHSLYRGLPDSRLAREEFYLSNADAHDLLVILQDKVRFFERNMAVNIGNSDPVKKAKADSRVDRIIAVEIIRDGKVDCSYLSRPREQYIVNPGEAEKTRYRRFNEAQEWVLRYSRWALPRGGAGEGYKGEEFGKGRR